MKKDITKRIDEFLPFIAAGAGALSKKSKRAPTGDIKKPQKGARLIVVGKRWWHWLYKGGKVIVWNDKGKKKVIKDLGVTPGEYFAVTPKMIERLIKDKVL